MAKRNRASGRVERSSDPRNLKVMGVITSAEGQIRRVSRRTDFKPAPRERSETIGRSRYA